MKNFLVMASFFLMATQCEKEDQDIIIYDFNGVTVLLIDVRDSRCPSDVTCVWEGNAEVDMTLMFDNKEEAFTLHTASQEGPQ